MTRFFLLMWCSEGFECVQDITALMPDAFEKQQIIEVLSGKSKSKNPLNQQVFAMKMRAMTNTQRHYEIYVQSATDGIEEQDLRDWADSDPQSLVDFVRKNHYAQVHSDRVQKDTRVII